MSNSANFTRVASGTSYNMIREFFDSRKADTDDNYPGVFQWHSPLSLNTLNVATLNIPTGLLFNVTDRNNKIFMQWDQPFPGDPWAHSADIYLEPGRYDPHELCIKLKGVIQTEIGSGDFEIYYNEDIQKLQFEWAGSCQKTFRFTPVEKEGFTFYYILGFIKDEVITSNNDGHKEIILAPRLYYGSGGRNNVFIYLKGFRNNNRLKAPCQPPIGWDAQELIAVGDMVWSDGQLILTNQNAPAGFFDWTTRPFASFNEPNPIFGFYTYLQPGDIPNPMEALVFTDLPFAFSLIYGNI